MAEEAKRVTIINQRSGKIILPPAPDELKKNPKAKARELLAGQAIEVSADEALKLLSYPGLVDASSIVANVETAEVKKLKADIKRLEAETAKLRGGKPDPEEGGDSETDDVEVGELDAKKGVACLLPDGKSTGVIVSVNKAKKTAKVKLDSNGNVSEFDVKDLKPAPELSKV